VTSLSDSRSSASSYVCDPQARPALLSVQEIVGQGRHTLHLAGELDIASRPLLDAALERLLTEQTEAVALDLSELTFMDSTGLHAVLSAQELCEQHGCELALLRPSSQVHRLFELSGLIDRLQLRASSGA
jgi:anti-sigma B factor antagonist